ncbi:MAG: ABC transporter permease [Chloroflexota bacterium]|nr:ABC transporter permease [Chloroflexota bacterium]MDP9473550.1 ABC transporter permease [Chloroflexota bacterium]
MTQFIARRLLILPVVLLGVSVLVFLVLHLVPGNPAQVIAGPDAPPETVQAIERELGLDRPLPEQYARYLGRVAQGDLGRSLRSKRPVLDDVLDALPNTIQLTVVAAVITPLIAIPLGVVAAAKRGSAVDRWLMLVSMLGITAPIFAVALGLMLVFGYELRLLPISGYGGPIWTLDGLRSVALPAVTLAVGSVAVMARLTRSAMLEVLNQDYVRVARAKGLRESIVLLRHGLKNAMLPITTVIGLQVAYLLSGAVVTETVFAWPGVGRLAVYAIEARDFPLVQGSVLIISVVFVLVNLAVDVGYAFMDPRIHYD